jgi:thiol-disulfide isomerase/thioredoxin
MLLKTLPVLALLAVAAGAQDAPRDEMLVPGSKAPALNVNKWVKGDPVTLEKGKVYVVEFWATWCGPCIASMPHLTELQETYKDKVTIVGVSTKDPNNTLENVEKMVAEKAVAMGYTVAWDEDGSTNALWMKAARQRGIPCSFLVDAEGKLAYIGHPSGLDIPLKRVVAGTWNIATAEQEMAALNQRFQDIQMKAQTDHAAAVEAILALEKDVPEISHQLAPWKFQLAALAGRDDAAAFGKKLVDRALKYGLEQDLNQLAWFLVDPETPIENRQLDLAMTAATKAVELSKGEDGAILDTLARVHYWKGDLKKAIEIQEKAVEKAAGNEEMLAQLQQVLEEYKAEAEPEQKPAGQE